MSCGSMLSKSLLTKIKRTPRNGNTREEFFPQYDVRLIAVSDGADSDDGENEFIPFRNIIAPQIYY